MRANSNIIYSEQEITTCLQLVSSLLEGSFVDSTIRIESQNYQHKAPDLEPTLHKNDSVQDYIKYSLLFNTGEKVLSTILKKFLQNPQNQIKSLVYQYFKQEERLTLQAGGMYGSDFVAYQSQIPNYQSQTPKQHTHSKYLIAIQHQSLRFCDVQSLIKVATSIKKDLVIVQVKPFQGQSLHNYLTSQIWSQTSLKWRQVAAVTAMTLRLSRIK